MKPPPTDQCIVLPFRSRASRPFDGTGLALHFLLGNVLVLNTGLQEMWFGWRVNSIFPAPAAFRNYCRHAGGDLDLAGVGRAQKVRFLIEGTLSDTAVQLHLFDGRHPAAIAASVDLLISADDDLVGFRNRFVAAMASGGCPMPDDQIASALWPEKIDTNGLDAVGRALEAFYLFSAYGGDTRLDRSAFEKAVAAAPASFMAHDLHGWACYRNDDYPRAKAAFLTALQINPAGAGAMSGLMWCGIHTGDLEEAMFWSGRKAEACGRDIAAGRESCRRRYRKAHAATE